VASDSTEPDPSNPRPVSMTVYRTAIPTRRFEHAAAARSLAEAVVVRLTFADGGVGWGETLPRPYVTGETIETVVDDLTERIWPAGVSGRVEQIETMAGRDGDGRDGGRRSCNAAICAFELARTDYLLGRVDRLSPPQRETLLGRDRARPRIDARVSGVLGSSDPARVRRQVRMMRCFGLGDFKLKLGFGPGLDEELVGIVSGMLGEALRDGRRTLRIDVNGGWTPDETPQRVAELARRGVCAVEQPFFAPPEQMVEVARRCELPLIADESLVSDRDADALAAEPERIWWNVRISKNGGLLRSMALARRAAERGTTIVLGCMVGETSLLSAAQRRWLQWGPRPRFVEGNYGRFLLRDDLTTRSVRFGYGGRLRVLSGPGLGASIDEAKLKQYAQIVAERRA
jgi:L-alanine-DL-glutamate epimerase-like enolase superfamily enzyme